MAQYACERLSIRCTAIVSQRSNGDLHTMLLSWPTKQTNGCAIRLECVAQLLTLNLALTVRRTLPRKGEDSSITPQLPHTSTKSKRVMSWLAPLEKHWLGFVQLLRHTSRHVSFDDKLFCKYAPQSRLLCACFSLLLGEY